MEHQNENIPPEEAQPQEQQEQYVPRPAWQVWGARIGLVLFILFFIYQLLTIAGGGM